MPVIIKNNDIDGSSNLSISASSTTYGITQDSTGRVRFPLNPLFLAYGVRDGTFNHNNVWRFATEHVDAASNYNPADGRFTAPIAGTYVFFWDNIGFTSNTTRRYFFQINGSTVRDVHLRQDTSDTGNENAEYAHGGMRMYMTDLSANDYVTIYYFADSGETSYPGGNSEADTYPTFMGFLLA
jgi:hypothetical protein